jgi:hypothetical protein
MQYPAVFPSSAHSLSYFFSGPSYFFFSFFLPLICRKIKIYFMLQRKRRARSNTHTHSLRGIKNGGKQLLIGFVGTRLCSSGRWSSYIRYPRGRYSERGHLCFSVWLFSIQSNPAPFHLLLSRSVSLSLDSPMYRRKSGNSTSLTNENRNSTRED